MISFESDYNNGAHPAVLRHLFDTNGEQSLTYGYDRWSTHAKALIREACQCPEAQVTFLVGGTQTNATVIDAMLMRYDAVIGCSSAHINIHEAGAVEASGHKVIALPEHEGKLDAKELLKLITDFENDESRDHEAQPRMVYITFPTELGTLYSAQELEKIYLICQQHHLILYIDGARLGYGLAASADVTLPFLAHHCDAFYIGGTKQGALCGEAVVFTHNNEPPHFFTTVKQHGALLAKGRLTGVQFEALFTDDLYLRIAREAIARAQRLKQFFLDHGFRFWIDSPTNQQFVILENQYMERLAAQVEFTRWCPYNAGHTVCRFVTSWATTPEQLDRLEEIITSTE